MSRVLVDTNLLAYGIDQDSVFYNRARQILDHSESDLVTTSKNLTEFLAVVTKSSGYDLDNTSALAIFEEIRQGMEVLYPSQNSMAYFLELMNKYQPKGLKIHDFEIVSIGIANGIQEVATFNTVDFKRIEEISLIDV